MSEPSRRLSYRRRKKLGLTLSEAFLEESVPPKARSVDRGYATVMSPASEEQGDEQSEWDERQARIDQPDGLSRLMSDMDRSKADEEASEEVFVGEDGMKAAMLTGFLDELEKLGTFDGVEPVSDDILEAFFDELEKLGGPMDLIRQRRAMAAGKGATRRTAAVGRGRMKGKVRSHMEGKAALTTEQKAARMAQAESAHQALTTGGAQQVRMGRDVAGARASGPGQQVQRAAQVRRGEVAPAPGRTQAADAAISPSQLQAERAALTPGADPRGGAGGPGVTQPVADVAAADAAAATQPGWLGRQWGALTSPVAAAYQQGGLGAVPGGLWQGMKASPWLGTAGAGLAGMAMLPPALRAVGLGRQDSPGAVPGMVNLPG